MLLNTCASSVPFIPFFRLCRLSYLQNGELFSQWKGQLSVVPLLVSLYGLCYKGLSVIFALTLPGPKGPSFGQTLGRE